MSFDIGRARDQRLERFRGVTISEATKKSARLAEPRFMPFHNASSPSPTPTSTSFSEQEPEANPSHVIDDFIDECIDHGIPEDRITHHVLFMVRAMKEMVYGEGERHRLKQEERMKQYEERMEREEKERLKRQLSYQNTSAASASALNKSQTSATPGPAVPPIPLRQATSPQSAAGQSAVMNLSATATPSTLQPAPVELDVAGGLDEDGQVEATKPPQTDEYHQQQQEGNSVAAVEASVFPEHHSESRRLFSPKQVAPVERSGQQQPVAAATGQQRWPSAVSKRRKPSPSGAVAFGRTMRPMTGPSAGNSSRQGVLANAARSRQEMVKDLGGEHVVARLLGLAKERDRTPSPKRWEESLRTPTPSPTRRQKSPERVQENKAANRSQGVMRKKEVQVQPARSNKAAELRAKKSHNIPMKPLEEVQGKPLPAVAAPSTTAASEVATTSATTATSKAPNSTGSASLKPLHMLNSLANRSHSVEQETQTELSIQFASAHDGTLGMDHSYSLGHNHSVERSERAPSPSASIILASSESKRSSDPRRTTTAEDRTRDAGPSARGATRLVSPALVEPLAPSMNLLRPIEDEAPRGPANNSTVLASTTPSPAASPPRRASFERGSYRDEIDALRRELSVGLEREDPELDHDDADETAQHRVMRPHHHDPSITEGPELAALPVAGSRPPPPAPFSRLQGSSSASFALPADLAKRGAQTHSELPNTELPLRPTTLSEPTGPKSYRDYLLEKEMKQNQATTVEGVTTLPTTQHQAIVSTAAVPQEPQKPSGLGNLSIRAAEGGTRNPAPTTASVPRAREVPVPNQAPTTAPLPSQQESPSPAPVRMNTTESASPAPAPVEFSLLSYLAQTPQGRPPGRSAKCETYLATVEKAVSEAKRYLSQPREARKYHDGSGERSVGRESSPSVGSASFDASISTLSEESTPFQVRLAQLRRSVSRPLHTVGEGLEEGSP